MFPKHFDKACLFHLQLVARTTNEYMLKKLHLHIFIIFLHLPNYRGKKVFPLLQIKQKSKKRKLVNMACST